MGANLYSGGSTFRVWAPNAEQVFVAGTFNHWSQTAHPLGREDHGYWSTDVPGAKAGDHYKYVIDNSGSWRIDPYARDVTSSAGNSIIHEPDFDWGACSYQTPCWNEMIIYEMHIGTFNDRPGGPPGNLNTAIEKLAHLHDLGVNAVQLMPAMEFTGGFSWGYNPAHIFAIESDYGGPEAFKELVKAAHIHDLAVIFDVVYNHWGPGHLDLWQFDGWSENNKGGIYFYNNWCSATPWGDTRPDYGRSEVRRYIRDNALMWLEEYRVDGLRWDATAYMRNVYGSNSDPAGDIPDGWGWRLMQWINDEIKSRQPWKISVAEDLRDNPWITKQTYCGGAGFNAQWDRNFAHCVREAIIPADDGARDMYAVRDAIEHRYNADAFERVIYTESHDEVTHGRARVPEEIWPGNAASWFSKKRSVLGAALVFTAPGIPMIFQGQEFLEDEWFHDRDPIDWSKKDLYRGMFLMYRDLIRLRRNWHDNTRGLGGRHVHVHHVNNRDKLLAFHRWQHGGPRDSVLVVVNLAHRAYDSYQIGFPRAGWWKVRFNSDWRGYDAEFGDCLGYHTVAHQTPQDGLPCRGHIGIGPYAVIILSQDD